MNALKAPQSVLNQLQSLGFDIPEAVHYNLAPAALYQHALQQREAHLAASGPLVACSAPYTGRSPRDRYIVKEPSTQDDVCWGSVNVPISESVFDRLLERMGTYAENRTLYVRDVFAGADPRYRLPVRAITEKAYHNLFIHNMFIRPKAEELDAFEPGFTILDLCDFKAVPERDGTRSEAFVIIHFARKLVLIGGTGYAGEMKKSIFSALNFMLPQKGVLPMHCSANTGPDGDTAIFFGLSGTGKTTLSADASRTLIGDDEHAWTDRGVYNFEGGCYAKLIRLSAESEPEIYATTQRFGTVLENVVTDPVTHEIDFDDDGITENTRAAYPIHFISNASNTGMGGHPRHVIMLTADAFGVMPPIARLTPEQAMYHFLSGYTAKVAGTEKGITEPKATFSACFGEPFMVLHPTAYAELLGEKIDRYGAKCWLINTGWTGGPYGIGTRMNLKYTRAMIHAVLAGVLDDVETVTDPVFDLAVPTSVPGVPCSVLNPRSTWSDPVAYDMQAEKLAGMFAQNFEKYADRAALEILTAGPVQADALH